MSILEKYEKLVENREKIIIETNAVDLQSNDDTILVTPEEISNDSGIDN